MPESLTVHTLSFKRASEMTQNREKYPVAGREEIGKMMAMATSWCGDHGYEPYYLYRQKNILGNLENVGYCNPAGKACTTSSSWKKCKPIVGLGCGASSKWVNPETGEIGRYANPKEPKAYNDSVLKAPMPKLRRWRRWCGNERIRNTGTTAICILHAMHCRHVHHASLRSAVSVSSPFIVQLLSPSSSASSGSSSPASAGFVRTASSGLVPASSASSPPSGSSVSVIVIRRLRRLFPSCRFLQPLYLFGTGL